MEKKTSAYSEFGYYLHRVARLIDKRGDELFRTQLGLSMRQFLLLRLIEAGSSTPPSQQDIADRLGIVKSAVSRHIEIAENNDWLTVIVSTVSRRQNMLALTPKGKLLLQKAKKLLTHVEAEGFGDTVAAKDVEATLRVLRSLYDKLV